MSRQDSLLKTGQETTTALREMDPAIHAAWLAALPERFDFYHLGSVAREADAQPEPTAPAPHLRAEDHFAIGFGFHGDMRGVMILLLDKGHDLDVYSELGNLLAARIALELHRKGGLDVMISPPYSVHPERLAEILKTPPGKMIRQAYTHKYGASLVRMEAMILSSDTQEVGHA